MGWFLFCVTSFVPTYFILRGGGGFGRTALAYLAGSVLTAIVVLFGYFWLIGSRYGGAGAFLGNGLAFAAFGPAIAVVYARRGPRG